MACRYCGGADHFSRNCELSTSDDAYFARNPFKGGKESWTKNASHVTQRSVDFSYDYKGPDGGDYSQPPKPMGDDCFNCGEQGHMKSECPQPRKSTACFNCGEEGHTKAECPKPRVFQGTCRTCGQEGHPAFQCPEKPPAFCRNCKREGHLAKDCTVNRKFDLNDVADKLPEEAWAMMKKASDERDIDDFREAFKVYTKAVPTATYVDIEKKLREEKFNVYLIALDKEAEDVITLIDLQGRLDAKYAVRFSLNDKPRRANLKDRWPADEAENMERLADAGQPFDRHIMKCRNCGEMGHGSRACKQERVENERLQIKCVNCDEPGHRLRDCPEPRLNKGGCRNCGSEEHHAKDCPEPRSLAGVECRKCNDMGHFAKDCPNESVIRTCRNCGSEDHMARDCDQPRDESTMTCRNCDQVGHVSRDCPEPKNWSRVKCNRCGEMGHTIRRCRQPEEGAEGEVCFYRPNAENVENDERHHGEIEEQVDLISDEFANQAW